MTYNYVNHITITFFKVAGGITKIYIMHPHSACTATSEYMVLKIIITQMTKRMVLKSSIMVIMISSFALTTANKVPILPIWNSLTLLCYMPSSKQSVEVCLCNSALVGQCVKMSLCLGFILPVAFMMFWMQTHIYFSIIKWVTLCLQTENTETSCLSFITVSELLESAETFYLENYCNFYKKKDLSIFCHSKLSVLIST